MKPKRPTDKELRLYASLSHVDGDLILDGVIPSAEAGKTVRASRKGMFSRPWAASLALCAVVLALAVSLMMDMGLFRDPATDPSQTDTTQEANRPGESNDPATPTVPGMDTAATLHRGMSLSELFALMGEDYTEENGSYTFTMDTGEGLTVSTAPNEAGETTVTGFAWLGDTAQAVNPLELPGDILHMMQEYATDKIIPVYTMTSLIGKYNQALSLPSAEKVLKDAELSYFRVSTDGNTVMLNAEGTKIEVYASGDTFTNDVSRLFDESVRIKAYYPIATFHASEGDAIYLQTSIGDYILYLHREWISVIEGDNSPAAVPVPYLLPVDVFHQFAYRIADKGDMLGIGWDFTEERMAIIEPYRMTGEGYEKPVNLATPESAAQVKVGMDKSELLRLLGTGFFPASKKYSGLYYWELTDGSGLAVYCTEKRVASSPSSDPEYTYQITDILPIESADVLDDIGTPTLATYGLLTNGMRYSMVIELMGSLLSSTSAGTDSRWQWVENGMVHAVKVLWSGNYADNNRSVASTEYSVCTIEEAIKDIRLGMSFADLVARLGPCRDGHEVDTFGGTNKSGYHFWTLPDGRCLAAYIGYDIPALTDPLGLNFERHFNMTIMHLLYLDSPNSAGIIGTPGLSMAAEVQTGMKEELVKALMGDPTVTVEGLQSVWEWSEGGKTYTLTVYWKGNAPVGFHRNFNTVSRYELSAETSSAPLIPDKIPTLANAQVITEGMTASELLTIMGSNADAVTGVGYTYYIWTLSDGQAFCAVTEDDVMNADQSERIVTYTYFRDSVEEMAIPTVQNVEAVTEGMSIATVHALLGSEHIYKEKISEKSYTWYTPDGAWWEITVTFEAVEYPETNRSRAYAVSVYIDKGI